VPGPNPQQLPDPATETSAYGAAAQQSAPASPEAVVRAIVDVVDGGGDLGALGDLIAADCVDHDPGPDGLRGAAAVQGFAQSWRRSFPDLHVGLDLVLPGDHHVSVAYTLTGTHTGDDFRGVRANGNGVDVRGLAIVRVEDGRVIERWGARDEAGVLRQISADGG